MTLTGSINLKLILGALQPLTTRLSTQEPLAP